MNINFDVDNLVSLIYDTVTKLCEKFGVIIDWSQENVIPYVIDVLGRYRIMAIVQNLMWPVFFIASAVWIAVLFKKSRGNDDYFWSYDEFHFAGLLVIVLSIVCVIFFIVTTCVIGDTLRWIFVPEIQWFDIIKEAIQ